MNLQNEQKQESSLERSAEIREPRERATEMLREGDRHVSGAKGLIESARTFMKKIGMGREAELKQLEDETDAAWDELASTVEPIAKGKNIEAPTDDIDAGWETAEKPTEEELDWGMPTSEHPAEDETTALASIEEAFYSSLFATRVDVAAFELLLRSVENHPKHQEHLRGELERAIGKTYAKRFIEDASYREELSEVASQLDGKLGEDGPRICDAAQINKLVFAHELFGRNIRAIVDAMNLSNHTPELILNTKEMSAVIYIDEPTFDDKTGDCTGEMSSALAYRHGEVSGRIERTFRIQRVPQGNTQEYQRIGELNLITLPHSLKGNGVAQKEMEASEQLMREHGFDAVTLHANIDVGGYAWAVKGYGWDIHAMREATTADKHIPAETILKDFIESRIEVLRYQFMVSNIDEADPMIASILSEYEACAKNPLAVTPQKLASIGKDGPIFIRTRSKRLIPETQYTDELRASDPPDTTQKGGLHAGKLFLLQSDWYGQKSLKSPSV
jgi:hypothetical protein